MTIELFFCKKGNKLVRGVRISRKDISDEMTEYTALCPNHPGETLKKIDKKYHIHHRDMPDTSDLPNILLPVIPGTVDEPSELFWEVFTKTVRAASANDDEILTEDIVLAWQNELSTDEKQELLDEFEQTGTVHLGHLERQNPEEVQHTAQTKQIAIKPFHEAAMVSVEAEFIKLNEKIVKKEYEMGALLDLLEDTDPEAAEDNECDMFTVARIIGYDDYSKDKGQRYLLLKQMEQVYGPNAMLRIH